MKEKDIELIEKDLCPRLRYGVLVKIIDKNPINPNNICKLVGIDLNIGSYSLVDIHNYTIETSIEGFKPFLRPMSSMTEEEKEELHKLHFSIRYEDWLNRYVKLVNYTYEDPIIKSYPNQKDYIAHDVNETTCANLIDWLNKHHFDYRGLIEKGLALRATNKMYKIE